jgi:AcrR family transcriptional regulator
MARHRTIPDADLLDAARGVFVAKGPGASTREVARRAGVSEGVLFQRYGTKRDLFFAAMMIPAADLTARLRARRADRLTHLEDVCHAMVEYFREIMPVLLPLVSHPGFRFEEFVARHPGSPLDGLRRSLVDLFRTERAAGRIGPVDPGAAALTIFALAGCVAFFERMGAHGGRFPPELVDRAIRCVWDGLAPRTPARGRARRPRRLASE